MNINEISKNTLTSFVEFPERHRTKVLKMALAAFQPTSQDPLQVIDNFSKDQGIPKEKIYEILSIYIALLRLFLENGDAEFSGKLKEIGFPNDFIENLPLLGNREEIVNNLKLGLDKDFGRLSSLNWRVDISLSNSTVIKKTPIPVVLSLTLKNGEKYTVEVEPKLFHKLRFSIAVILNELNMLKTT